MWRGILAAVLVYGCGHPALEGYRPEWLERPLQGFYQDVQKATSAARVAMAGLDQERIGGYIRIFTDRFKSEVSKDLHSVNTGTTSSQNESVKN